MTQVRRLDDDHDMTFGYGLGCIAERSEACAQNVKTRLLLLEGEWFMDLTAGVPWLQKILIKQRNGWQFWQRMIQNILSLNTLPEPADIADALALAVGHSYMCRK